MQPLKRGAFLMLGAVVAGSAGVYFGERHLSQRAAATEAALRSEHATETVVVAKRDLAQGTTLNADQVALRDMPVTYIHQRAVRKADWGRIAGGILSDPVNAGEPLLPSQLRQSANARLAELVEVGDRAITVPVSGSAAIAGLLNPGDRVDLMLTHRQSDHEQTIPLLSDVPLLATGQRTSPLNQDERARRYTNITLAVSPMQAARITHALAMGSIHVVLRADDDDRPVTAYRIDAPSLIGAAPTPEPDAAPAAVEVIIGGQP